MTASPATEFAYSSVDWDTYVKYRLPYRAAFFDRIYGYHAQKPQAGWGVAHDVGAGRGIVSAALASRFDSVVVSDPNDGHVALARGALVQDALTPASKFRFLPEGAERSSVGRATVDLITACECIHFTDPEAAVGDFGRQLKPGGTLAMTYYAFPRIVGNDPAESIWRRILAVWSDGGPAALYDRAFRIGNTALDAVGFPDSGWKAVKRIYVNARGSVDRFAIGDLRGKSRVKEGEDKLWIEGDQDWRGVKEISWFKGYLETLVPCVPESKIRHLWDELELALDGKGVEMELPNVMVLATKE
ncbi:hypothetical protein CDD83_7419 [Cordyceps sp. RAO-2017]|nr:hypothetical protein CDD83_7419 [Cordyceps sp. RAO-2017]